MSRKDRQRLRPERIGEPDTQPLASQRNTDDLAERGIAEPRFGWHVGRLGRLGRGRPGPHPAVLIAPGSDSRQSDKDQPQKACRAGGAVRLIIG